MSPPLAIVCVKTSCGHKNVTAYLKSGACQRCGEDLPEEHVAHIRGTFRTYDRASGEVILPIASVSTVAVPPAGIETCGDGATAGKAYTEAMDALRSLEAKIAFRKQSDYDFVPDWMHKELSRLRAIEKMADKQLPVRAAVASQTAAEEAKRLTIEVAEIQAKLTAAHKEAAASAAEIFGRIATPQSRIQAVLPTQVPGNPRGDSQERIRRCSPGSSRPPTKRRKGPHPCRDRQAPRTRSDHRGDHSPVPYPTPAGLTP